MHPFLYFDKDPYLVLADGRLFWMVDAYTISDRYPYSEPIQGRSSYNYIRNSVKVVVDTYNGQVDFFHCDSDDPIIRVYDKVFENTFKPLSAMPQVFRTASVIQWTFSTYKLGCAELSHDQSDRLLQQRGHVGASTGKSMTLMSRSCRAIISS